MDDYIRAWTEIIAHCQFDNTYKMAWAKSLLELSVFAEEFGESPVTFLFADIAALCLKHYWNQTIYFDLIQGSNLKKIPEIHTHAKVLIARYREETRDLSPKRFERVDFESLGMKEDHRTAVKRTVRTLKKDVCWRFPSLRRLTHLLYGLDKSQGTVTLQGRQLAKLKEFSEVLSALINYRWAQILEQFNHSPRISAKVRVMLDDEEIRRSPLRGFRKYLDVLDGGGSRRCFHCGMPISENDLSIDHVIPWSFLFSDDLWNLVYCHKGENSAKSNTVPDEKMIAKLEERNQMLLPRLMNTKYGNRKATDELRLAIEKDYVRKFWIACRG